MAGGTYTDYNKTLPGVYIRYQTEPDLSASVGERGTVAIARQLKQGEFGKFIEITDTGKLTDLVGFDITSDDALFVREMTRGTDLTNGAKKILLWRLEEQNATKASRQFGNLTVTAKTEGQNGNNISIAITPISSSKINDVEEYAQWTVDTYYNTELKHTQTIGTYTPAEDSDEEGKKSPTYIVGKIADLEDNNWVSFSGDGHLTACVATNLENGQSAGVKSTAYSDFLTALSKKDFNVVVYDGTNTTIKNVFASFVKRMSTEEGKYCVAVMADYVEPNSEFCISIKNGYTLATGEEITPEKATWWLGGAQAGAGYNESLTYHNQPAAVELLEEYENTEISELVSKGHIVLMKQDGDIKIVTDINTFTTFTPTKARAISKNRVMRTIFQICNDLYTNISKTYIGKIDVNSDGVSLIKGFTIGYLEGLQANRALKNFEKDDVTVLEYEVDSMQMGLKLQPVDSLEKIYIEILIG